MIKTEFYMTRKDGVNLYRTYSTSGMMIEQTETNVKYSEAIDPEGTNRQYIETNEPIIEENDAQRTLDIIFGGAE